MIDVYFFHFFFFFSRQPWDTTTLWVADLEEGGLSVVPNSKKLIAGGSSPFFFITPCTSCSGVQKTHLYIPTSTGKDESVAYPDWSGSNVLTFISDRTNWWNLYQRTASVEIVALCPKAAEFCGPQWEFGHTPYSFVPGSESILGKCAVISP